MQTLMKRTESVRECARCYSPLEGATVKRGLEVGVRQSSRLPTAAQRSRTVDECETDCVRGGSERGGAQEMQCRAQDERTKPMPDAQSDRGLARHHRSDAMGIALIATRHTQVGTLSLVAG